jgi:hypothetical protein
VLFPAPFGPARRTRFLAPEDGVDVEGEEGRPCAELGGVERKDDGSGRGGVPEEDGASELDLDVGVRERGRRSADGGLQPVDVRADPGLRGRATVLRAHAPGIVVLSVEAATAP